MTSSPATRYGLATGRRKCGVALPISAGNGFVPKSRIDGCRGLPLYQTPSCDVSP